MVQFENTGAYVVQSFDEIEQRLQDSLVALKRIKGLSNKVAVLLEKIVLI